MCQAKQMPKGLMQLAWAWLRRAKVLLARISLVRGKLKFFFLHIFFYSFFIINLQIFSIFFYTQSHKILLLSSIHNLINSTCIKANTFISRETQWIRNHYLNQSKLAIRNFFNISTCLTTFDCILGKTHPSASSPRIIVLEKVNRRKSVRINRWRQVREDISVGRNPATGDVLIIAQQRGSTLRHNILRGSAKPPTSTGKSHLYLEIRERIQ